MNQSPPPAPPPAPNPSKNPYDFISNPTPASKKSMLPGGNSALARAVIVGVGIVILIIIAVVVNGILNSSSNQLKSDFLTAAQQQTELIRISEIGIKNADSDKAKDLAVTANLVITSDYNRLVELASSSRISLDKKQIALGKNAKTDELLEQAEQISQFDTVFVETMQSQLESYQITLKSIFDASQKESSKELLSDMYQNVELIIGNQSSEGVWLSLPATKS